MLHFAYGSNMSRALMHRRCPQAKALGGAPDARHLVRQPGFRVGRDPCDVVG